MKHLKILILILVWDGLFFMNSQAGAAFKNNYKNPHDLINSLKIKFHSINSYDNTCQDLQHSSRVALGDTNLMTGESLSEQPEIPFLNYWNNCLSRYGYELFTDTRNSTEAKANLIREILGDYSLTKDLNDTDLLSALHLNAARSPQQQLELIQKITLWALGEEEEILSYGLMTDLKQYQIELRDFVFKNNDTLGSVMNETIQILLSRDEFLKLR